MNSARRTAVRSFPNSVPPTAVTNAPKREVLRQLAPEQVLDALEAGSMITMAAHRSRLDHRAIAEYVTGKKLGDTLDTTPPAAAMCAKAAVSDA